MGRTHTIVVALCAATLALTQAGCVAQRISQEEAPADWTLNVHQPGEWWKQPLIPRAVVLERCPPGSAWTADPDITTLAALPPGSDIEYGEFIDDWHCNIGWSEPATQANFSFDEMNTEEGLRRICSSSGLPMDTSWRFLGHKLVERAGDDPYAVEDTLGTWEQVATAAFVDEHGTVAGCIVEHWGSWQRVLLELSVGSDLTGPRGEAACPRTPTIVGLGQDDTVTYYDLKGAGAVRDNTGRVLTEAASIELGLRGDSLTTSHPVVDGIAIVSAEVATTTSIRPDGYAEDWPPLPVEGTVHGADGSVLTTCRG